MSVSGLSFQPSCALGGSWYACGNGTKFVGCCTSYPCTNTGCSQGNLRPASFLASAAGSFPDQECSDGKWFTCNTTKPSFLGCCKSNACLSNGCPSADLRAGFLSSNTAVANQFKPNPPLSSSSTTTTSTSSQTSSTSTLTSATSSTTSTPDQPSSLPSTTLPTIVSATVGSIIVSIMLVSLIFFISRRRKRAKQRRETRLYQQRYFSGRRWSEVSQSECSLYPSEIRHSSVSLPNRDHSLLYSPSAIHSERGSARNSYSYPYASSPRYEVHEAGGRELTYMAYSPYQSGENSPAFPPDALSATDAAASSPHRASGFLVRGAPGNSERQRAELG